MPEPEHPPGWLPKDEYDAIYSRVSRLCVEVVLADAERGVVLSPFAARRQGTASRSSPTAPGGSPGCPTASTPSSGPFSRRASACDSQGLTIVQSSTVAVLDWTVNVA